jgi:hypothetical protein
LISQEIKTNTWVLLISQGIKYGYYWYHRK